MRSTFHKTFGAPSDVLEFGDMPAPTAGPSQVLVRTILSPIHNHDLWTVLGAYGYKPVLPAIGGTEAVGTIEAVGEGVDIGLIGTRVAVSGSHGTWAELFVAPAQAVVPVPEQISDEWGAQLISMPFSAISLLEFLNVSKGDWVIQSAANGAVGKVFAALAKTRGVNVVNLVRRAEAKAELLELGISNIVVTDDNDWKAQVAVLTGDAGARAAVDSIGGELAADLTDLLGFEGLLVSFGSASGVPLALNSGAIIFKQLTIRGFWGSKIIEAMTVADKVRLIGELVTLAAKGELPLSLGGVYPFEQVAKAVTAAQVSGRKGKILLRP